MLLGENMNEVTVGLNLIFIIDNTSRLISNRRVVYHTRIFLTNNTQNELVNSEVADQFWFLLDTCSKRNGMLAPRFLPRENTKNHKRDWNVELIHVLLQKRCTFSSC